MHLPCSFAGFIGIAREDITPPSGIYSRNWGAARHDVAAGIHRPLTLTCVTFQETRNSDPLVLIAADLGWWKSKEDEWFLRGEILNAMQLDAARVMICLSHTHAGPSLFRGDHHKPGGQLIEPYLESLRASAVAAVKCALKKAVRANLLWRYGKCDLATNRDLPEPRRKRIVCGYNPQLPADDTLLVGRVTAANGTILATIANYACHPTTLAWENRLISPDYVGAMREIIETQTHAPCVFLQGASGELAPAEQYSGDPAVADTHGRRLGYAALSALAGMPSANTVLQRSGVVESGAPLAIWKQKRATPATGLAAEKIEVALPLKPLPCLADLEAKWRGCQDHVLKERLWRAMGVRKAVGDGRRANISLWVWRLGDSFLVGYPNEAYSELQLKLREEFQPAAVAVMNVVNGHIGYLPPKSLYEQNIYSVWQTPFARGSLERVTRAATTCCRRLAVNLPFIR